MSNSFVIENKLRDNDIGNAERFYEKFKGKLIHVSELNRWHEWKHGKWTEISFDKVISDYAALIAKDLWKEIAELGDSADRDVLSRHAKRTHDERQLRAMVNVAKGHFSRSLKEFDSRTHWLNCKNGVLNFEKDPKEMTLDNIRVPVHPNMLMLKQAGASYNPSERSDVWEKFVSDVFMADQETISWFQMFCGYLMLGSVDEQIGVFAYGTGGNGKSILFETLQEVLGDYAVTTESDIVLADKVNGVRDKEVIGKLQGARLAVGSEVSDKKHLNTQRYKLVTGGDTLIGAKMYGETFEVVPHFKLVILCNHLPPFFEGTEGVKRRLLVLPFKVRFKGDSRDKNIKATLLKNKDGILTWCAEGAIKYLKQERGLPDMDSPEMPEAIRDATLSYILANDEIGRFMKECFDVNPNGKVSNVSADVRYREWMPANKRALNEKMFVRAMKERIPDHSSSTGSLIYFGYTLKEGAQPFSPEEMSDFEPDVSTHTVYSSWQDVPKQTNEIEFEGY